MNRMDEPLGRLFGTGLVGAFVLLGSILCATAFSVPIRQEVPCRPLLYPCAPAGQVIVVALDGSGDYRNLQAAVDAVGDGGTTIRVKPGVYRLSSLTLRGSGSADAPHALVAYDPVNPPVLDFGVHPEEDDSGRNAGVNMRGTWWLLDHLVVRNARNGVFVIGGHATVRHMRIEDVHGEGILVAEICPGFVRIAENTIVNVGRAPEPDHPQGRHGVYVSNDGEHPTRHIEILNNNFFHLSGAVIHLNGSKANAQHPGVWPQQENDRVAWGISDVLIQNNAAIGSREGINLYRYVFRTVIRRNTIVFRDEDLFAGRSGQMLQIRNAAHNTIAKNVFAGVSRRRHVLVGYRETEDDPSNGRNTFRGNVWCMKWGARMSWDLSGGGVKADRSGRNYEDLTGDHSGEMQRFRWSGICTEIAQRSTANGTPVTATMRSLRELPTAASRAGAHP